MSLLVSVRVALGWLNIESWDFWQLSTVSAFVLGLFGGMLGECKPSFPPHPPATRETTIGISMCGGQKTPRQSTARSLKCSRRSSRSLSCGSDFRS